MFERMIRFNKYPRFIIEAVTGQRPEHSIFCVGNTIPRYQLEKEILAGNSVNIYGPRCGKMTAVMEIIDRHEIDFRKALNLGNFLFVLRTNILSKEITAAVKANRRVVLISDAPLGLPCKTIAFQSLTEADRLEYQRIKGEPMIDYNPPDDTPSELQQVLLSLRGQGDPPPHMEMWLAQNFYKNKQILDICMNACRSEKFYKDALLKQIKTRRPPSLKNPVWVKRK